MSSCVPAVGGRPFDRILFLQSLGDAADQARTLRVARGLISADGFIVVVPSHPIRFVVERMKKNGTLIGEDSTGCRAVHRKRNDDWDGLGGSHR